MWNTLLVVVGALIAYSTVAYGQTPTGMSTGNPAVDLGLVGATLLMAYRVLDVATPLIKNRLSGNGGGNVQQPVTVTTLCDTCQRSITEMHALICARTEDGTYRMLGNEKARDLALAANTEALKGLTAAVKALSEKP